MHHPTQRRHAILLTLAIVGVWWPAAAPSLPPTASGGPAVDWGHHAAAITALDAQLVPWRLPTDPPQAAAAVTTQLAAMSSVVALSAMKLPADPRATRLALDSVLWRKGLAFELAADAVVSGVAKQPRERGKRPRSAEVQAGLPRDTALIEYVVFRPTGTEGTPLRPRYAAFVLRAAGEPSAVDLGDGATIDAAVTDLRDALAEPGRDPLPAARRMTDLVLRPLRPALGDSTHWLVSPDRALALLPFAALLEPDGRWVVQRRTVTLLATSRDVVRKWVDVERHGDAVVLADPDLDESSTEDAELPPDASGQAQLALVSGVALARLRFLPLRGAMAESDALVPLLRAVRLTGTAATETALRRHHGPRILHLATRGWFLPQPSDPTEAPLLRSGLALAGFHLHGSGADDGTLTARDAISLDLTGTQLVVLSGCQTSATDAATASGVQALARAFQFAGAESVLMSLWRPDEQTTGALMTSLYGKLSAGETRAEALRRAQLELMSQPRTRAPYFWATFQLTGNWRVMR